MIRPFQNGALCVFFLCPLLAVAQQNRPPNIGYIYPAGGRAGSTIDAVIGGMNLRTVNDARVSGGGISIEAVHVSNPLGNISNDLRRELKPIIEAIEKGTDPIAASKESAEKELRQLRKQAEKTKKAPENKSTQPVGKATKRVESDDKRLEIAPGERLIYIDKTPEEVVKIIKGLAPLEYQCLCKEVFSQKNSLQTSPAIDEKAIIRLRIAPGCTPGPREIRLTSQSGASNPLRFMVDGLPESSCAFYVPEESPSQVGIAGFPHLFNGEIMPGEIDKYRFNATRGETFLFSVKARDLIPFLGDAVPGWFQPVISVHDGKGALLAYCDDRYFDPDPVLLFTAPADGDYELWLNDSIYRGREDFVYRLKAEKADKMPSLAMRELALPYDIARIKGVGAKTSLRHPRKLEFPILVEDVVAGRNAACFYSIALMKGEKLVAEAFARRLDSPMDPLLQIFGPDGKLLASNDDAAALNVGINAHQADSYTLIEAPAGGRYVIRIADAQSKGGADYRYVLRLDKPRPDFTVYRVPSALNAASGSHFPFKMKVLRRDGFNGPINISVGKGPEGLSIAGGVIPPGADEIMMTLYVPQNCAGGFHELRLCASAEAGGKVVERDVIATDEVMQAFLYLHLLPAMESLLHVRKKGGGVLFNNIPRNISLEAGQSIELAFESPGLAFAAKKRDIELELLQSPPGISIRDGRLDGNRYLLRLQADQTAKAWQGNLVFVAYSDEKAKKKQSRAPIACIPAIPAVIHALPSAAPK
jgi:hypothetical protein